MFLFLESRIMSATTQPGEIVDPSDEEIDAIITEFGSDPKAAIRALLHDLSELALDSEAAVSRGYVRGNLLPFKLVRPT
jgi:hypothetical protein